MADNDLNNAEAVTQPEDLNSADVVNQQNLTDQVVQDQNQDTLADGTSADKSVPYTKLKEEADKRRAAEEQAAYAQRQLELMQAQQQGAQMAQVAQKPETNMERAMRELNLTADDMYGENIIAVQNRKDQLDAASRQQQSALMATQQFVMTHPDVNQVVGSVNPSTGQVISVSQELRELLTKKPHLTAACTSVEVMYDLVIQERKLKEFERTQSVIQEQQTRQNVENATQPLGGSAAGGISGGNPQGQSLLSKEQVLEIEAKLAAGETV